MAAMWLTKMICCLTDGANVLESWRIVRKDNFDASDKVQRIEMSNGLETAFQSFVRTNRLDSQFQDNE